MGEIPPVLNAKSRPRSPEPTRRHGPIVHTHVARVPSWVHTGPTEEPKPDRMTGREPLPMHHPHELIGYGRYAHSAPRREGRDPRFESVTSDVVC